MYNGIGLSTVRGSGTNGYVQKNMSHVNRKSQVEYRREMALVEKNGPPKAKKPDAGILEHNRKRKIELKIVEFQDAMEEQGYTEEEVEKETSKLRTQLMSEDLRVKESLQKTRVTETHAIAAAKEKEMRQIANAFGIRNEYEAGSSFNAELQAQRRDQEKGERDALRAEKEAAWKRREAEREESSARRKDQDGADDKRREDRAELASESKRDGDRRDGDRGGGRAGRGRDRSRSRSRGRGGRGSRRSRSPDRRDRRDSGRGGGDRDRRDDKARAEEAPKVSESKAADDEKPKEKEEEKKEEKKDSSRRRRSRSRSSSSSSSSSGARKKGRRRKGSSSSSGSSSGSSSSSSSS